MFLSIFYTSPGDGASTAATGSHHQRRAVASPRARPRCRGRGVAALLSTAGTAGYGAAATAVMVGC